MKNNFILILFSLVFLACSGNTESSTSPNMDKEQNLAGGWQDANIESNEVKDALTFVISKMNTIAKLKSIISAKQQVVKGMNYDVTFSLDNGEIWNVVVYRDLDGKYLITKPAALQ